MKISQRGLALIKEFEGCSLMPYRCPAGILTVGYGSTGPHVKIGKPITQEEAEALLLKDVRRFEKGVELFLGPAAKQQHFDALVSFSFNLGLGNLLSSTLLKKHKRGDYEGAANEFLRWNKANGNVLPGLTRRRAAERSLYLGASK